MENALKVSKRDSFTFVGRAIINDRTFTVNKTNEAGTWVHNALNLAVDCGLDCGTNYCSLMGGYNPTRDNIIYVNTIDENGKIRGRDYQEQIAWDDRLNLTEDDWQKFSMFEGVRLYLETDSVGKTLLKRFLSPYDAVLYIKEHLSDGDFIKVVGHIDYLPPRSEDGDWTISHVVERISLITADESSVQYTATADLSVLVDENVLGKVEEGVMQVPLYYKSLAYVGKVNGKKYNQVCAFPRKVLWDLSYDNEEEKKIRNEKIKIAAENSIIKPSKKGMLDEVYIECQYRGGVKKNEVKLEDLDSKTQQLISLGMLDMKEVTGNAITGTTPKELYFKSLKVKKISKSVQRETDSDTVAGITFDITPAKYKDSEILFFEDLEPIEDTGYTAPVDPTPIVDDIPDEISDIAALLNL